MTIFLFVFTKAHAVRTFKPVRYDPVERKLLTSDKNNDKKFAFITQETVVDYRPVEVRPRFFAVRLL